MCQPVTALQAIDGWWLPALCLIFCSSWWQPFLSNLPDQHCHNGLWQCSNAGLPAQMHIYSFCWQKLNSFFRIHKIAPYKMSWGKFSTTVNGVVLRTNHWEKTLCDKSFSNSNVLFPGKEKILKKKKSQPREIRLHMCTKKYVALLNFQNQFLYLNLSF